jgi:hypothetical protein
MIQVRGGSKPQVCEARAVCAYGAARMHAVNVMSPHASLATHEPQHATFGQGHDVQLKAIYACTSTVYVVMSIAMRHALYMIPSHTLSQTQSMRLQVLKCLESIPTKHSSAGDKRSLRSRVALVTATRHARSQDSLCALQMMLNVDNAEVSRHGGCEIAPARPWRGTCEQLRVALLNKHFMQFLHLDSCCTAGNCKWRERAHVRHVCNLAGRALGRAQAWSLAAHCKHKCNVI